MKTLTEYAKQLVEAEKAKSELIADFYGQFGRNVSQKRTLLGITQEQLAIRVGLGRTSLTNIEKGKQKVLLHDIVVLASALDTTIEELMPK